MTLSRSRKSRHELAWQESGALQLYSPAPCLVHREFEFAVRPPRERHRRWESDWSRTGGRAASRTYRCRGGWRWTQARRRGGSGRRPRLRGCATRFRLSCYATRFLLETTAMDPAPDEVQAILGASSTAPSARIDQMPGLVISRAVHVTDRSPNDYAVGICSVARPLGPGRRIPPWKAAVGGRQSVTGLGVAAIRFQPTMVHCGGIGLCHANPKGHPAWPTICPWVPPGFEQGVQLGECLSTKRRRRRTLARGACPSTFGRRQSASGPRRD